MRENKWILIVLVAVIAFLLYRTNQQKGLALAMSSTGIKAIGNSGILQLEEPKAPKLLAMKVIVKTAGAPVKFPTGKPVNGKVRLSTRGNTGTVYLGDSPSTVKDGVLRFGIAKDKEFDYEVSELSTLWLDADTDGDYCEIMGEIS